MYKVGRAQNNIKEKVGEKEIITPFLPIPTEMFLKDIASLIEFCFPKHVLNDPIKNFKELCGSSLLAPTNRAVEQLNGNP